MTLTVLSVASAAWPIDRLYKFGAKLASFDFLPARIEIGRVIPWASLSSRAMSRQRDPYLYVY